MKLFNHQFKTTIITLVLLLLVISNTINAFDSNEKVRDDLHPYIMAHTEGVKDMRHGQYAFAFYGSLGAQGGAFPLNRFKSLDLTTLGTSYYVCDINNFRYFKQEEEITVKNPINYKIVRQVTKAPPIVAAPIAVLQTISKITTSPITRKVSSSNRLVISKILFTPSPNWYTNPFDTSTLSIIHVLNLNGRGAMLKPLPPTTPIAYKINSEETVTNLLLPKNIENERLYLSFSRQWDIDYCHYINILQLSAPTRGIQVVSAATNRYGDRHVGYQSTLVTELERSSMINIRRPDGSIVSELFTFPTTFKSREFNWQYLINQAFDFFITNKVENFRSFENWKIFLDSAGYQDPFPQIVKKALIKTQKADCKWSQMIQRVKGSGKQLMFLKETVIPIDPPFDVSEPTCKPNAPWKMFPCLKTPLPNFVKDPNNPTFDCDITAQFRDQWKEAIIESATQNGKIPPADPTKFIDEKTEEFKVGFQSFYSNDKRNGVIECAKLNK
ncbi:hypothetical protein DFA_12260 [Cavenderia fasciculata]|uniref:Uncharacterized protein n=1 Tax=Cavenderia fasciculata TaxID=261658 RepID=F4QCW2_CACFS|nr:uncharacterized protein DFA_12260 [Cavenderia fasciculata]EGG14486.1 hypothetical protein DFA_12260 [Cavenderia fasciculata]|eukprot:XP_004353895.1 hypothetical protein DFA_12260 [Cavenderia fasciculata]